MYTPELGFTVPMDRHATRLRAQLEEEIVTGKLPPGTRLDEVSLADRFGVSRTPIREALFELSSTGLIETRPRRGAVVASLGPGRLVEMFEVMAELEGMCGRLAARRMSDAERNALEEAHLACERAADTGDVDDYYRRNERFHEIIYDGCHNGYLGEQARLLRRRLQAYRRLQLRARNRMSASLAEHAGIVEAILSGDEDGAEARLRAHVIVQGERFADMLSAVRALQPAAEAGG